MECFRLVVRPEAARSLGRIPTKMQDGSLGSKPLLPAETIDESIVARARTTHRTRNSCRNSRKSAACTSAWRISRRRRSTTCCPG